MSPQRSKRPPGQIRQSQVITTFGPGALVNLPGHSVLSAGQRRLGGGDLAAGVVTFPQSLRAACAQGGIGALTAGAKSRKLFDY